MGKYPASIESMRLGVLQLDEGGDTYEVVTPVAMPGTPQLQVVAWPPEGRAIDPAEFAAFVDRTWDRLCEIFDAIMEAAGSFVDEEIDRSYDSNDVKRPTAESILQRCYVCMVKIDGTDHPLNSHEIVFNSLDFMGGHDITLRVARDLEHVLGVYLDG